MSITATLTTEPTSLIYMPEESTPTIATPGNREAIAYLELGEHTDYYGQLFASAPRHLDALLTIKHLAEKSGDHGVDPFTLLDLIVHEVHAAIQTVATVKDPRT